ncbi:hypothetical protein [Priestia megaterium]|uniref:hypothetical protein n=1 Tax=Priestia megaterium TaxID=1404 RepID=UPI0015E29604|nr:hypothetical protein [Priestia megaterium]
MFTNEQIKHLEQTSGKRNEILDNIVKRANKRSGQHILEIVNDIRQLCDDLEKTV